MKQKGFTLIELLVVVAIIGNLAAVGIVAFNGYIQGAKKNTCISQHNTIRNFMNTEILKCESGSTKIFIDENTGVGKQCPITYNTFNDIHYIANALHADMKNISGDAFPSQPSAPLTWPISAFYNSNLTKVRSCYKRSVGCHMINIYSNTPDVYTLQTKCEDGGNLLMSTIQFK